MAKAKNPAEKYIHVGLRIPPVLYNRLLRYANKNRLTVSETIRELTKKGFGG